MEGNPASSEGSARRSKRIRVQRGGVDKDYQEGVTSPSDKSPIYGEQDESSDGIDEVRHRPKKKKMAENISGLADQKLIEIIRDNGKFIPQSIKLWVEHYEKNPKPAVVELLKTLFQACGAMYNINENVLDEIDVDDVVVALVDLAKRGEIEDYQGSKKKEFKTFKDNLVYFWHTLVIECQNGPLFDNVLFEKCIDYIIALSCTPPRVYRHVASLMGLQLVTSFIDVAKMLGVQRETTQRQLNAEKKKNLEGPRLESLNKRLPIIHEKKTYIDSMIRKIFTGLFIHRYRDIDSNIRMSCIQSLGAWILSYPEMFLEDLYLKYLGWTLNDKNAGVRKASVLALQSLYEVDDYVHSLFLFTERFSSRMIDLADDIDISVAVCAIGLVKQLLRHELLNDNDLGPLYDLLIDDPPEIRHAIGDLVYDHLIAQKFNGSQSHSKGNEDGRSEVHLGRILQILREFSSDPILSTYVIDDIWEYPKAMKDWKCIISMLLDENPIIELTEVDTTSLIRLLNSSIKKAVGERIVPATDNRKQQYTKAQKDIFESNKRDVTIAMLKNYPLILRKFSADKEKCPSLIEIIIHMNLELYSLKRQEQNFKTVLLLIKEAFFKHGEKDTLRSCVKAMTFCCNACKGELQDFSQSKLKDLEDDLVSKLTSTIRDISDDDDKYSLIICLKRMYELHLSKYVPLEDSFEHMLNIVRNFKNANDEIVCFSLLNMHLHIHWLLYLILNSESVAEASLYSLLSKRDALLEQLELFLDTLIEDDDTVENHLGNRVCIVLAELWCLFRKEFFSKSKLECLVYSPNDLLLQKLWNLCARNLSSSAETEDDEVKNEYAEDINREAVVIAVCKLVTTTTIVSKFQEYLAPEIISHYVMHGAGVAEIIKHFISALRKRDENIPKILLESLKRSHGRNLDSLHVGGDGDRFSECKELAVRLSGTVSAIGTSRNKNRTDLLEVVTGGISYAFENAPRKLSFLDRAVLPFASRLTPIDTLEILKDVQKRVVNVNMHEDPSGWHPYTVFADLLHEKCAKIEGVGEREKGGGRRRGRPPRQPNMKGKKLFDGSSSAEEDEDSISMSEGRDRNVEDERMDTPSSSAAAAFHRSSLKLRSIEKAVLHGSSL